LLANIISAGRSASAGPFGGRDSALAGWLAGWLVGWLVGLLAGWLAGLALRRTGDECAPTELAGRRRTVTLHSGRFGGCEKPQIVAIRVRRPAVIPARRSKAAGRPKLARQSWVGPRP